MGRIDDTCRLNVATVKNDIGDGLWAEGGSPLFQLDGQLRGTSVTRIVRFDVSFRQGKLDEFIRVIYPRKKQLRANGNCKT